MEFITARELQPGLILFEERVVDGTPVTMMLAIGEEKAAVMDAGFGFSAELLEKVRRYTEKPLICLLTHCDPDHAGGATLFDRVYMNRADEPLMKAALRPLVRLKILENLVGKEAEAYQFAKKNILRDGSFDYTPIKNGDHFDLGGRILEAVALPGHTAGSMCFVCHKEQWAFTGDSIANVDAPVLFFDKCRPLAEYRRGLARFVEVTGQDYIVYTGHRAEPLPKGMIGEIFELCDEVLAGNTEGDVPYMPPFLLKDEDAEPSWLADRVAGLVSKHQLGDSVPMQHRKEGAVTKLNYNANRLEEERQ